MDIDKDLKKNLLADVENVLEVFLSEDQKEQLARCFEITIGTHELDKKSKK